MTISTSGLFSSSGVPELTVIFFTIFMDMLTTSHGQKGFLSIDCGSKANYTDSLGLIWITDDGTYIKTGTSLEQSFVNQTFLTISSGAGNQALQSFRHFPERRNKDCYEFKSETNVSYLIRASFYMNKYELTKRRPFKFITSINANEWFTLQSGDDSQTEMFVTQEAIFNSPRTVIYFCLQPEVGVPFISSLELRQLEPSMYSYSGSELQLLTLLFRYTLGSSNSTREVVRFPYDSYDRIWEQPPPVYDYCSYMGFPCGSNPTPADNMTKGDVNNVPSKVMQSAWLFPRSKARPWPMPFYIMDTPQVNLPPLKLAYVAAYAEDLNSSASRSYGVEIALDAAVVSPATSGLVNVSNQANMLATPDFHLSGLKIDFSLRLAAESNHEGDLPLNAVEAYAHYSFNFSKTVTKDINIIEAMKKNFSMTDWQGDPCSPVPYDWLTCTSLDCWVPQGFLVSKHHIYSLTLSNLSTSESSFFKDQSNWNNGFMLLSEVSITNSGVDNLVLEAVVSNFTQLHVLDLSDNAIESIPSAEVWQTEHLEELNLSHNELSRLDSFQNVPFQSNLRVLDLSHNAMTSVPTKWVNTTNNMVVLDLSYNQLEEDISFLDQLVQINSRSLQKLNISNNKLGGVFPSSLYFTGLPNLTIAIFDQNFIQGTLNLSAWYNLLQKAAFGSSTGTNVKMPLFSFVNNSIYDIIPSDKVFEPAMQVLQKNPAFFRKGILLGGNPYCEGAKSYIQKYLCRSTINEEIPRTDNHSKENMIIAICIAVFFSFTTLGTSTSLWKFWKEVHALRKIQQVLADEKVQPLFFKWKELKCATGDFCEGNELGEGGFGKVYVGTLEDKKSKIAVKKLFNSQNIQVLNDFLNEVVLITGIKHKNLVQLKGCCIHDNQRMLVYEYAEKGNLAEALWGSKPHGSLTWEQRFNICVGVARGLSYLHEELQPPIIHRDIKPENILLDTNLQPKIADFGLARNFLDESSKALYTQIIGTLGYFSPEYATQGELTEKADVYSFGIVVLEVVSGRKCIDSSLPTERKFLKDWVLKLHRRGLLLDILQPELSDTLIVPQAIRAIKIGLLCVQQNPKRRPSMSQVITMFLGNLDVEVLSDESQAVQSLYLPSDVLVSTSHGREDLSLECVIEEDSPSAHLLYHNSQSLSQGTVSDTHCSTFVVQMSTLFGQQSAWQPTVTTNDAQVPH